jgi:hypothetical protein
MNAAPTLARIDRTRSRALVYAGLALALGVAVYLVRPEEIAVFGIAGVSGPVHALRAALAPLRGMVPTSILGVLPDVAWAAALAWVLTRLRSSSAFLVAGFVLCAGWEIGQGLRIVPGTFDVADLVASIAAYAAVVLIARFIPRKGLAS